MEIPDISESAYIAPGAQVIGNVKIGKKASVWYNAVIRGDMAPIEIGEGSNIQDNCTLHCDEGIPLVVGKNVTVGHNAVLHSCNIGDGTLIGIGAVVLSGAKIGKGCLIAAGSVITPGTEVLDGRMYIGVPAKFKRILNKDERQSIIANADEYKKLINLYKA